MAEELLAHEQHARLRVVEDVLHLARGERSSPRASPRDSSPREQHREELRAVLVEHRHAVPAARRPRGERLRHARGLVAQLAVRSRCGSPAISARRSPRSRAWLRRMSARPANMIGLPPAPSYTARAINRLRPRAERHLGGVLDLLHREARGDVVQLGTQISCL